MANKRINKEKVFILERSKYKSFNSREEYDRFCETINSDIDENDTRTTRTISKNKIKGIAARLGTRPEVLLDEETYNTLVLGGELCSVNRKCNNSAMVDIIKDIIKLRDHDIHISKYKPMVDITRVTPKMINEYILANGFDSVYIDRWAKSAIYDGKLEIVVKSLPYGIRIYYYDSDNHMVEVIANRRIYD